MHLVFRRGMPREAYGSFAILASVGSVCVRPVVLESVRIDGKPRKRHISTLPSFYEHWTEPEGAANLRLWWWPGAAPVLDRLGNRIPTADMAKIRAKLIDKIGTIPTPDEIAESRRRWDAEGAAFSRAWRGDETEAIRKIKEAAEERRERALRARQAGNICGKCEAMLPADHVNLAFIDLGFGGSMSYRRVFAPLCDECAKPHDRKFRHELVCAYPDCERPIYSVRARETYCSLWCKDQDKPHRAASRAVWQERGIIPKRRKRWTWARHA